MKILIADAIDAEGIAILKTSGHEVIEAVDISVGQLRLEIPAYDALIVRGRTKVTKDVIDAGKNLKVITRAGIGVDNIDVVAAKAKGITVVNAPGSTSQAVAEHTIALILALSRNLVPTASAMSQGQWVKDGYGAFELSGKTLGIIGFGTIGSIVAAIAHAMGMHIVVATHKEPSEKQKQRLGSMGAFVSLEELLATSDIVCVHAPLTDETRGMVGATQLARMKKSAYLVNTARGAIVDEAALVTALTNSAIAGAALDVFTTEPLAADSPLRALPNVILTPHVASVSPEGKKRASMMVCEDVDRLLKGQEALHSI